MNIPNDDQSIFLENIIDTIRESLIVLDEQMRVLTVNRSFLTQFQVSSEETVGKLVYDLGNGQWNIPMLHDLLENIIPHQTTFENYEVRHRFETIGEKVMQLNARRLIRTDGKSSLILLAIEDITEKYINRQKLQESETLYRKFTEEANSIVIGLDSNGIISFFNGFSEKVFGYDRNEVIGKPFLGTILPPVDCRGHDYTAIVNEILTRPEKFYAQECEGIRKDGGKIWFSFSIKGIRESIGTVREIIIDGNDITELQDVRLGLNEKSAMLDTLLTFIPEGVIVCDAGNIIRYASKSIEGIFELPVGSLLNTSGDECLKKIKLYHSDGSHITSHEELPMYKVVKCGKPCSEYNLFLDIDGIKRIVSIDAAPILDPDKNVTGAVGVWHDATEQKNVERALRESENLFHAAVENYTSLFVIYDKNRRMQYMNKFGLHLTSLSEDQIAGKLDEEVIPPEVYKHYLPHLIHAIKTKEKQHFEFDLIINNHFYSYINDYVPLLDENGDVYQILSIAMDITDRKQVEKAMRESEERFRTLADNISQLAWMADPDGSIFWFNKRWYEFTGTTYNEIKQKGLSIIVDPDYFESVMSGYVESVKSGTPWTATFPMKKYDGSYRWFLSHAMPIYDGDHTIVRWFGTNTDVTELREAQQQLHVAAERFQKMMSSNIIGLVIADFDGSIISGNDYYYNLTGYTEEEFTKKLVTWKSITPPEYLPVDYRAIDQMHQNGSIPPYEKQYIRKDGTRIWVLIAFTSLPGTTDQCIAFVLDITERKQALDEAQRRRAENEAILDSIPDGYIIMDAQGSILKINDRARSALGKVTNDHSLPYYDWISSLHLSDRDGRRFQVEELPTYRALHGETVRDVIIKIPHAEEDLWVSASASPITVDEKRYGVILEISDITELHKLQEQIAEERNFVNAILQTSGALITVLDNNQRILRFNKACEKLTGFTADEVKGQSMLEMLVPEEEHETLLETMGHFNRSESVLEYENHWKTKSGQKHFIRWRKTAWFDAEGNVKIIIASGIDISDRMQLEQQLRSYKSRLEYDLDAMKRFHEISSVFVRESDIEKVFELIVDAGIAITKADMGNLQLYNSETRALVIKADRGLSKEYVNYWNSTLRGLGACGTAIESRKRVIVNDVTESPIFVGKPDLEIQLKEQIKAVQSTPILSRSGEPLGMLSTHYHTSYTPDDHSLWLLDLLVRLTADIIDRINIQQKLAESKQQLQLRAEELAESNRDLESFSYSVSHDLRSPLNAVKGFSSILQEDYIDKLDDAGRDYLQRIKSGVNKMTELISDILNLSKIGSQEVKRETINLSTMVRNYLEELTSIEPGRRTEFIIEEDVMVNADPHLVHVELENLLRNAWKFTSKKDVTRIEFGRIHLDGKTVFYLRDNGIGFDQKFAKRIFEPFRRVHSEKEYGGTGIGLSIVQRVVKKHSGEVWAESTPGEGAAFYFTLG